MYGTGSQRSMYPILCAFDQTIMSINTLNVSNKIEKTVDGRH